MPDTPPRDTREPARLDLNKSASAAALTPAARCLHRRILTAFADTGHAPSPADLDQAVQHAGIGLDSGARELSEADLVLFNQTGRIRAAYPFSPLPTFHQMTIAGGPDGPVKVYAMCAIDALGTSAMLGRPVTVTSTEPGTGHPITVHVDGRTATWDPPRTVVYAAGSADDCCTTSADRTCSTINFFTTRRAAEHWASRHPDLTGRLLHQDDALTLAIAEFGDLLLPPAPATGR